MYDWHLVPHKKPASAGYGALPALAGAALLALGCAWLRLWDVIVVYFSSTHSIESCIKSICYQKSLTTAPNFTQIIAHRAMPYRYNQKTEPYNWFYIYIYYIYIYRTRLIITHLSHRTAIEQPSSHRVVMAMSSPAHCPHTSPQQLWPGTGWRKRTSVIVSLELDGSFKAVQ